MQSNPAATVAGHEPRRFIVAAADAGRRIDAVVAESLGLGRRGATRLLQNVRRNGRRVRKGDRLTVGDEILLHDLAAMVLSDRWAGTGPTPPTGSAPSNPAGGEDRGPAELADPPVILRATASVLVVDKPSGLPSVAIAGRGGPSLASWAAATQPASAGRGGPGEHGLAHRLDTPTSGLVLIALTDQAHTSLRRQFTRREIEKTYLALVHGEIDEPFEIEAPIGQHRKSRRRMRTAESPRTIERHAARPASTSIQPIEQFAGFTVVRATSRTGMRPTRSSATISTAERRSPGSEPSFCTRARCAGAIPTRAKSPPTTPPSRHAGPRCGKHCASCTDGAPGPGARELRPSDSCRPRSPSNTGCICSGRCPRPR